MSQSNTLIPNWKPNFFTLAYGQFISVLITGTGVFASLLSRFDEHANNPMLLAALTYFLLFLYFNIKRVYKEGDLSTLKNPWYVAFSCFLHQISFVF